MNKHNEDIQNKIKSAENPTIENVKKEIPYEEKYLEKYRQFSMDFQYTSEYLQIEKQKYNELIENQEIETTAKIEKIEKEAQEYMHDLFLKKFKNNFIIENTPLGNVAMCYNHERETFEYFSDKTMPYRYLEPVSRKYVMTYHCKPLYIDMEYELKQAEEKMKQEHDKQKEMEESQSQSQPKTKDVFAKLKKYNQDAVSKPSAPPRNNRSNQTQIPNHIKSKLAQIQNPNANPKQNQQNILQLLKENANRYTHSGRFVNFMILKSVDRKVVDKKYALSYKDYIELMKNKSQI
jgi:hypothetical protein